MCIVVGSQLGQFGRKPEVLGELLAGGRAVIYPTLIIFFFALMMTVNHALHVSPHCFHCFFAILQPTMSLLLKT
jgi:hypothetical protein